jgi:transketolase
MLLTRQDVPVLDPEAVAGGVARGGYVLSDAEGDRPAVVIVASGSEVGVAVAAKGLLRSDGIDARVVSMPSWELFDAQSEEYQRAVLTRDVPAVSLEAGVAQGWLRWVDATISIERFGASAPGAKVLEGLGITPERAAECAKETIRRRNGTGSAPVTR